MLQLQGVKFPWVFKIPDLIEPIFYQYISEFQKQCHSFKGIKNERIFKKSCRKPLEVLEV